MTRNPDTAPVIAWLETRRLRKYADGGLVSAPTTPTLAAYQAASAGASGSNAEMQQFTRAVSRFERVVSAFPTEVKARMTYTDFEDTAAEVTQVRADAAI